jgi:hypothetical protein
VRSGVLVAVVVFVGGVVGCSSGDDAGEERGDRQERGSDPLDGSGREAYVLALGEAGRDPVSGAPSAEGGCVAEVIVDVVGVERLREVATAREVAAAANGDGASLAELGVEVDAAEEDEIYAGVEGCGDPAAMFLDAIPGAHFSGPVADCFRGHLDDAVVREVVMARLVDGDDALIEDPEVANELTAIGRSCAAGGT